jgi:D-3-phosphoglycerate dehydrogenase
VIGKIGTILGQGDVNIAGMQLGRERQGGMALALLLVDNPVGSEVISKVREIDGILTAKVVRV